MIRIETPDSWLLAGHKDHARLAGEFARHWKNVEFLPPEPFAHVLDAVARHDDSWIERDAAPQLTHDLNPSAFSRELVGSYDAFEEIDLEEYLGVRGAATEAAAGRDPYAAILISMHTVNLLTEQADLSTLTAEQAEFHSRFIQGQRDRQEALKRQLRSMPDMAPFVTDEHFERGFRFLQCCDSFSLFVCVDYDMPGKLRHPQPTRSGGATEITLTPLGDHTFRLAPWPLDADRVEFEVPVKKVAKSATVDSQTFRSAYAIAVPETVNIVTCR